MKRTHDDQLLPDWGWDLLFVLLMLAAPGLIEHLSKPAPAPTAKPVLVHDTLVRG
jgi:hypothetical protein